VPGWGTSCLSPGFFDWSHGAIEARIPARWAGQSGSEEEEMDTPAKQN
jgi:hypothetical protein